MRVVLSAAILVSSLVVAQAANAQNTAPGQLIDKVYLTAGLQGVGLGLGKTHSETMGFRVDLNGGSISDDYAESGTNYRGELELQSAGAYFDYFPFSGAFRLTAGLAYFGSKLDLTATGNGTTADIGGRPVVLTAADRIDASVDWPGVAPYLGLGFGHGKSMSTGFYLGADLGVYLGKFKSNLTVSPSLRAQLGPTADADIQRERDELEDAVSGLGFVPSLQAYVGYRF